MSTTKLLSATLFAALAVANFHPSLYGQSSDRRFPGKPANPGASELHQSYRDRGSMGGGYRPYSAWSYQSNARTHAQGLNTYGQTVQKGSPETVKEHVAEIRKNVGAAKKEVGKLGDEAAKKAEVKKHVDSMLKHYDEAEKMCKTIEDSLAGGVDHKTVCDCCKTIDDELKAAEDEHKQMLEILGLPVPGVEEHAQHEGKPEAGPKKATK